MQKFGIKALVEEVDNWRAKKLSEADSDLQRSVPKTDDEAAKVIKYPFVTGTNHPPAPSEQGLSCRDRNDGREP